MIALIYGSRTWDDDLAVHATIESLRERFPDVSIIHGACPTGADNIAQQYCYQNHIPQQRFPADWKRHKKKAGRIRNTAMRDFLIQSGEAFVAIGFRNDGNSFGTDMMTSLLLEVGIEPTIVHPRTEVVTE